MTPSPESVHHAGSDGAKRRKGSKLHLAVDMLGHRLALHVIPTNEQCVPEVLQSHKLTHEGFLSTLCKRAFRKEVQSCPFFPSVGVF